MISFTVYGQPAAQGSKRALVNKYTGRASVVENSKRVKPWRQDVKAAALEARNGAPPLDGPLWLRVWFTLPKPKSAPKKLKTHPDKKPDVSKLVRALEDALVDAGVMVDDARIVRLEASKVYPNEDPMALEAPGARVELRWLEYP